MRWHFSGLLHERVNFDSFRAPAQTSTNERLAEADRQFYDLAVVCFESFLLRASPLIFD
jgi:hypothetical protein